MQSAGIRPCSTGGISDVRRVTSGGDVDSGVGKLHAFFMQEASSKELSSKAK